LTDKCCCEIGCTITNTTGNEYGDWIFSTRPDTINSAATERLRIMSNGYLGIWTTSPLSKFTIRNGYRWC
jgi:hypothetical protein